MKMGGGNSTPSSYLPTIRNTTAPNAQAICPGYTAHNVQTRLNGMTAALGLSDPACNAYGTDIETLELTVEYQDKHRLSVTIQPMHMDASNISHYVLDSNLVKKPEGAFSVPFTDMHFDWGNTPSFWFAVKRQSSSEVLFSTQNSKIVYENQFIEFATQLPENYNVSGLGEHMHALTLEPGLVLTNWNADQADPVDLNMYGTNPVYLDTRYAPIEHGSGFRGSAHGVYWRNSHGLEFVLGERNLTFRAIGGAIELYFLDGPSPADVIAEYTTGIVGLPAMQQYWTFGFHQCHWGYKGWDEVQNNIDMYRAANIPLETQWVDIDYMNNSRDFTLDALNFSREAGERLIGKLHADGQHFVPILDVAPWFPDTDDYEPYNRGHDLDIFIKNPDGTEFVGQVWPGPGVWPDWQHPDAERYFANEIALLHSTLAFDGIWMDLNEPSNFCTGSCNTETPQAEPVPEGHRDVNYPPYAINNAQGFLSERTVATNATHYGGIEHYDIHNIYGFSTLRAIYSGLIKTFSGKRPFIIGRSTFAGVGHIAGHWGGDNYASWLDMYFSIPQALSNSLFGIPMFGPDTCGISGPTESELCGRWMQLSAFFPFYRNHYAFDANGREAWRWPEVAEWSRKTMEIRYSILPYIYTLFHAASTTGSTVMRALAWEFVNEPELARADRQFLLGPAIMVIPVLNEGAVTVAGVFPGDDPWYDWYNMTAVPRSWHKGNTTLYAPQGHIPIFIRGGHVIPMQEPAYTIAECRKNPWSVLVATDKDGSAKGSLYSDDGESLHPSQQQFVEFVAWRSSLVATVKGHYGGNSGLPLAQVTIIGVSGFRGRVHFNGRPVSAKNLDYDKDKKILRVTGLGEKTREGAWEKDWRLTWH